MSTIKVNNVQARTGNIITVGGSGDNIVLGSGATTSLGKIGQVIQGIVASQTLSTSASFVDIGFGLNITPTSTSSKILAIFFNPALKTGNANTRTEQKLYYTVGGSESVVQSFGWSLYNEVLDDSAQTTGGSYLHSPASISQLTYTVKFNNVSAAGEIYACWGNQPSSLTLMEVLP